MAAALVGLLALALAGGGLTEPGEPSGGLAPGVPPLPQFAWQQQCGDDCAAALGPLMWAYDRMNCEELARDRSLYSAFDPSDVDHHPERLAAIADRIAFEHCD